MNPTTEQLIKEGCLCNLGQSCRRCDRLQGRLDVYEGIRFIYNLSEGQKKYLDKEILMIKEVLK